MYQEIVFLAFGLIGLALGADFLIKGAKDIAEHFGISQLFIGLTLVSIGTSIPEIGVSIMGALDRLNGIETSGIVVGNAIGSSLSQITLILGMLAFLVPLSIKRKDLRKHGAFLIASVILVFGLASDGYLSRGDGFVGIMAYAGYYLYLWYSNHVYRPGPHISFNLVKNSVLGVFGLILVWFTSDVVVDSAISISETLGVSQSLIGILLIGLGTGLPELSVAIISFKRNVMDISMGALIGSNICDLLLSLGIGTMISGFVVESVNLWFDLPVLFIFSLVAMTFFYTSRKLSRKEGLILMGLFVVYALVKVFVTG